MYSVILAFAFPASKCSHSENLNACLTTPQSWTSLFLPYVSEPCLICLIFFVDEGIVSVSLYKSQVDVHRRFQKVSPNTFNAHDNTSHFLKIVRHIIFVTWQSAIPPSLCAMTPVILHITLVSTISDIFVSLFLMREHREIRIFGTR